MFGWVAAFVPLGLVASTLVAWTCVAAQYARLDLRTIAPYAEEVEPGPERRSVVASVSRLVARAFGRPPVDPDLLAHVSSRFAAGFGVRLWRLEASVAGDDGEETWLQGEGIEAGWPMSCVTAMRVDRVAFPPEPVARTGWLQAVPPRQGGGFGEPPLFSLEAGLTLPARPLLPGMLVNAAIYATGAAGVSRSIRCAMTRWRRRHLRCEACGHSMIGARSDRCPECGNRYGHR